MNDTPARVEQIWNEINPNRKITGNISFYDIPSKSAALILIAIMGKEIALITKEDYDDFPITITPPHDYGYNRDNEWKIGYGQDSYNDFGSNKSLLEAYYSAYKQVKSVFKE